MTKEPFGEKGVDPVIHFDRASLRKRWRGLRVGACGKAPREDDGEVSHAHEKEKLQSETFWQSFWEVALAKGKC